jgi:hypothetical protein
VVKNEALGIILVAGDNTVNGFKSALNGTPVDIRRGGDGILTDALSDTTWDLRGKYRHGALSADLTPVALSDEYWFSWKQFYPSSQLIRVGE